ncbi:MAG: succinate dehydrogenase assembly factor 4 [Peristeroidobacter soli]
MLIFVFAGVSYSRTRPILAEFAPVPNASSDVAPASAADDKSAAKAANAAAAPASAAPAESREFGGPPGPEPTRFGDWEKNGRCVDF